SVWNIAILTTETLNSLAKISAPTAAATRWSLASSPSSDQASGPTLSGAGPTLMSALLVLAAIIPAGQTFHCTPTHLWDGDGPVWCAEGPRIRLSGIAARETDGACRGNQPCPEADATEARDALVALLGEPIGRSRHGHILVEGPTMRCLSTGDGVGNR